MERLEVKNLLWLFGIMGETIYLTHISGKPCLDKYLTEKPEGTFTHERGRLEVLASIAGAPVYRIFGEYQSFYLKTSDNHMGNDYIHE